MEMKNEYESLGLTEILYGNNPNKTRRSVKLQDKRDRNKTDVLIGSGEHTPLRERSLIELLGGPIK